MSSWEVHDIGTLEILAIGSCQYCDILMADYAIDIKLIELIELIEEYQI